MSEDSLPKPNIDEEQESEDEVIWPKRPKRSRAATQVSRALPQGASSSSESSDDHIFKMAASRIPPEVFEMILQFAPDSGLVGFKVDKRELQEDAKITIRENQFGPISIRSPNQLRLLSRTALAYVRRWKSSKLLCEIWMKSDEEDFSKAEVELSFLHSNAIPLVGQINRKAYLSKRGKWLSRLNPSRFLDTGLPAEAAFKGLADLASSYYLEHVARIELHVYIAESSVHLAQFCKWFHCFWLYVLEKILSAATLPTSVDLTCGGSFPYSSSAMAEQNVREEMPNNFQRLDFSQLGAAYSEPLLRYSVAFIFNAGRATIKHVAGSLFDIPCLGFQPGAAAASCAFPAVKQIDAVFNENFDFAPGVNPFAQLVSLFPSLESLNLYSCGVVNYNAITMDLLPLLQNPNLKHFQFGGDRVGWTNYNLEMANPLSRWSINHPGVRSIRLMSDQDQHSNDMPAEDIVALRKLLNLNAASYDSLELINMFSMRQFLAIFDAYTIFPKVAGLRRLSLDIDFRTESDPRQLLEGIVRLFALIERTMPHLSALYFGAKNFNVDLRFAALDASAFEFARSPEIVLLSLLVENRPRQLKELTLNGILQGPNKSTPGNYEQWLLCTLRCLIETNLSCLVVSEAPRGRDWPLSFIQRWMANPGSIKDLFKSLPPADTKGKRLQGVKFYAHKREVEFPYSRVAESMRHHCQSVELCCVLVDASTAETQTLRLRSAARIVS